MIRYHRPLLLVTAVILAGAVMIGPVAASKTGATPDEITKWAISTPKPDYPYNARLHYVQGRGVFLVRVRISTGRVKEVTVVVSTGAQLLDQAAINGLSVWRFKPGMLPSLRHFVPKSKDRFADEDVLFKVPVTFVMNRRHRPPGVYEVRTPF